MAADAHVHAEPATPERWEDVASVMGRRGDPSHCWCQFFRLRGKDWQTSPRPNNRAHLREQVHSPGHPPGVIAYIDQQPVGWCAIAPKSSYPRVVASPTTGAETAGIWSVTCFVVKVGWRRRGLAATLLDAAVELARSSGAATVEAYPVDPSARKSVASAELYHGTLSTFLDAGFTQTHRPSPARALVQQRL